MTKTDLYSNLKFLLGEPPKAATTNNDAFVSEVIDMRGYLSCLFIMQYGAVADANVVCTPLLEDSATSFSGAEVVDADMYGTETLAALTSTGANNEDNAIRVIGYHGNKRYCRLTVTPSGNGGDLFLSMTAILVPLQKPISQPVAP